MPQNLPLLRLQSIQVAEMGSCAYAIEYTIAHVVINYGRPMFFDRSFLNRVSSCVLAPRGSHGPARSRFRVVAAHNDTRTALGYIKRPEALSGVRILVCCAIVDVYIHMCSSEPRIRAVREWIQAKRCPICALQRWLPVIGTAVNLVSWPSRNG